MNKTHIYICSNFSPNIIASSFYIQMRKLVKKKKREINLKHFITTFFPSIHIVYEKNILYSNFAPSLPRKNKIKSEINVQRFKFSNQ